MPPEFFAQARGQAGRRQNRRVATMPVVLWLMIWQQNPEALSSATGAYNKARQALPVEVVEHSCDRIFNQLMAARQHHQPPRRRLAFLVSEQRLLEKALDRLPPAAVVVGDANFGVFSVAWAAPQRNHPVLLGLTAARAQRLAGRPLGDGIEQPIYWRPCREDRHSHPDLPPEACVQGRLLVRRVQPHNRAEPILLALFTTLEETAEELLQLYAQRWSIETDLRSLKSTPELNQLRSIRPEMVAKELAAAILTYNLVRALTASAAQQSALPPRRYSFTRVRNVRSARVPLIATAQDPKEAQKYYDRMMYYVSQAKLPQRWRPRPSYPREVWSKGPRLPNRKD